MRFLNVSFASGTWTNNSTTPTKSTWNLINKGDYTAASLLLLKHKRFSSAVVVLYRVILTSVIIINFKSGKYNLYYSDIPMQSYKVDVIITVTAKDGHVDYY